jgi:preprotein translocase subunit SecB
MKPKNSPLSLVDINILASSVIVIPTPDGYDGDLNSFLLDIDFNLFQQKEDESKFKVMVSIDGNDPKEPSPGYCFNLVAEGIFNYKNENCSKPDEKDLLLSNSAIPIVIGHLRSHLITLTANGPYEKYILPVVDFSDLLQQKNDKAKEI